MNVSKIIDRVKPFLPRRVRTPLATLASYLRGRRMIRDYSRHYRRARAVYRETENRPPDPLPLLPRHFGVRVAWPAADTFVEIPSNYPDLVRRVAEGARERLAVSSACSFFPALPPGPVPPLTADVDALTHGGVISLKLTDPFAIAGIKELGRAVVKQLEERVFGSFAVVDRLYVYRSPISRQRPRASWLWHYDNYPREILKVMIYLSDVTDDTGPFEYLRHRDTGAALPGAPLAPDYGDARISEGDLRKYLGRGYEPFKVTGPTGTMLVFDNNVVHRATLASKGHRDVVVFQVRPATVKGLGTVGNRWTGSFRHTGFNRNPDDVSLHMKREFQSRMR